LQIKTKIVSCHTADSKPVKQEVNGTVILPPLVFTEYSNDTQLLYWVMPQLLAKNPSWNANNQRTFVVNCHQDIMASNNDSFFKG
jgi:hypothetical protein